MIAKLLLLLALPMTIACGSPAGFGGDAGDGDADPSADAADDHKTGIKFDAGDAGTDADVGDAATTDAPDGGTTGPRRVFVTFTSYDIGSGAGQFKGLSGADGICQGTANGQALGGTWKAWLSSSTTSVAQRFSHAGGPFKMLDGTVIANDWVELTSGTLQSKPSVDETGHPITDQWVWTDTLADGSAAAGSACGDWTSPSDNVQFGKSMYSDGRWTGVGDSTTSVSCNSGNGLYCFEQ